MFAPSALQGRFQREECASGAKSEAGISERDHHFPSTASIYAFSWRFRAGESPFGDGDIGSCGSRKRRPATQFHSPDHTTKRRNYRSNSARKKGGPREPFDARVRLSIRRRENAHLGMSRSRRRSVSFFLNGEL